MELGREPLVTAGRYHHQWMTCASTLILFFFFWFFLSVPNLIRLIYKYATSLTIQSIIDKDLVKRTEGGLDPTRPLQSTPNIATIDQLQPTISVQRRSTGVDQLSSGLLMPLIMISNLTSSPSEYPVLSF